MQLQERWLLTATAETCRAVTAAPSTLQLQHCQSGIRVPETPALPHHSQHMRKGLPTPWPSGNTSGAAAGLGSGPGRAEQSSRRDHPLGWAERERVSETREGPSSATSPRGHSPVRLLSSQRHSWTRKGCCCRKHCRMRKRATSRRPSWHCPWQSVCASRLLRHRSTGHSSCDRGTHQPLELSPVPTAIPEQQHPAHLSPAPGPQQRPGGFGKPGRAGAR